MKNHAFLILAHKQPSLLGRIVHILQKNNHYFYIHIDKKVKDITPFTESVKDVANVKFLISNRISVYHAAITEILATFELIKTAVNDDTEIEYYHLISGQDYPLRSNFAFDSFFENTEHSFMYIDHGDFRQQMIPHYNACINEFHFNKTSGILYRIYEKLGLGKFTTPFKKRLEPLYGGWEWASWNKTVAEYIVDYFDKHPEFLERFDHTCAGVEIIYCTLLMPKKEELHIEINNPLRYVSWHPHREIRNKYRPYTLNELDYNYIIDSKAFFCRKVDEIESAKLLDLIDKQRDLPYNLNEHKYFV